MEKKLATITMTSTPDKTQNIEQAFGFIRQAAKAGADWVMLPEMFSYFGDYGKLYDFAETEESQLINKLKNLTKELNIVLFAGTVPEKPTSEAISHKNHRRVFNTAFVFDRGGNIIAKYRKTHLFNLYDQGGKALYCESDGFLAGDHKVTFELEGYQVGLAVCYDLRFTEFFNVMTKQKPIDILAIPSAFTKQTGEHHWEVLLRARAIELQCYVFAANQTGTHYQGKTSYGHSMIIDPWGTKLIDTYETASYCMATISKNKIKEVRAKLPALQNKRKEIYQ